jgi:hypothetical protein
MRRLIIATLSICTAIAFTSCNQEKIDKLEAEKMQLQNELHKAEEVSSLKDSTITDFFEALAEIESNLEQVRTTEQKLGNMRITGDVKTDTKEQIIGDITAISELLGENKKTIKRLNQLLSKSNINSDKLKESIASLEDRINTKDAEINRLTNNLSNANTALSALNQLYITKVNEAESLDLELSTAYYAFGTFKELKENKVLSKEGSIIGIGGAKTLAQDFNKDYFKKINIKETSSIKLYSEKDVELATEHPSESYTIANEEGSKTLQIKDATAFWSVSKYLVVITK